MEAAIPISSPGLVVDGLLQDVATAVQILYLGQVQVQEERLRGLQALLRYLEVDGVQVRGSDLNTDNKPVRVEKTEALEIASELKDLCELFEPNCDKNYFRKVDNPYENKDLQAYPDENNTDITYKTKERTIQKPTDAEEGELKEDIKTICCDDDGADTFKQPAANNDKSIGEEISVFTTDVGSFTKSELQKPVKFDCQNCEKSFTRMHSLNNHQKYFHEGIEPPLKQKPYSKQCKECDYKADTRNKWSYHRSVHLNIKFSCDLCDFQSKHKQFVLFHKISKHNIGKRFECKKCEKSFTRPIHLTNHQKYVHEGVEQPPKQKPKTTCPCKTCDFQAKSLHFLNLHIKELHPESVLTCEMCSFTSVYETLLKEHKDNVHEGVTYKCSHCEAVLKTKRSKKNHERLMHRVKPFLCSKCDRQSSSRGALKIHEERDHEGVRYNCDICGHMAKGKHHLKIHKECKHEGVKYTCDANDCNTVYSQKENLANHKKTKHEGVSYPCKVEGCEYKGSKKSLVLKHKRIVHDGVVYRCPKCDYKAGRPEHLKTHIKKHPFTDELVNESMTKFRTIQPCQNARVSL